MTPPGNTAQASAKGLEITILISLVVLCQAAGLLGSFAATPSIDPWYDALAKPAWTPPPPVYPIVWTALYIAMAVAAWIVWRHREVPEQRFAALWAFFAQLALNIAWSWAFFAAQSPLFGLIVILALGVFVFLTALRFYRIARIAGGIMFVYFIWVAFATVLNAAILVMNA